MWYDNFCTALRVKQQTMAKRVHYQRRAPGTFHYPNNTGCFTGQQFGEPTILSVAGACGARGSGCITPSQSYTPLPTACCPAETVGGSCQCGSTMTQIVETENMLRYDPCLVMQPGVSTFGAYY
jgi:hypothetical protein